MRSIVAAERISGPIDLPAKDLEAHAVVSREGAEQGAVLLKNDGAILPLGADLARVAVIGGHADKGVLTGSCRSIADGFSPIARPSRVITTIAT